LKEIRGHYHEIETIDDILDLFYTNFEEYDVCDNMCPRCDLVKGQNGNLAKFNRGDESFIPFGCTDAKVSSSSMVMKKDKEFLLRIGPTDKDVAPFSFTGKFSKYPHLGIPTSPSQKSFIFNIRRPYE